MLERIQFYSIQFYISIVGKFPGEKNIPSSLLCFESGDSAIKYDAQRRWQGLKSVLERIVLTG